MTDQTDDPPRPIFVGGSARTGTHVMGRLIAAHPRYALVDVEARFHSGEGGLCDLLEGEIEMAGFLANCRERWWARGLREHVGLQRIAGAADFEEALERFEAEYARDPLAAARGLVRELLDPVAERAGKPAWVEVTGRNIQNGVTLRRLFGGAKFIHMFRDGRAVAAGILRKPDMTDDLPAAVSHWVKRVRKADLALRQLPRDSVLTVFLDDLTAHDRERTYRRVADFLELGDDAGMRRFFDARINADRAHVDRWRERIAPADVRWLERRYRRVLAQLRREGVQWLPEPDAPGPGSFGRLVSRKSSTRAATTSGASSGR
jgi:Sulfotransferase family